MEFVKKIGWARMGLLVSAILLVVMGALCFFAHGLMPHAMHNTGVSGVFTVGGVLGGITMLICGVSQLGAYYNAGGVRALGGWLFLCGVMCIVAGIAALIDPFVGTFTYEWVIAVFVAFVGLATAFGAITDGRKIGYKGWALELILGLVMVVLALGVVYNSALAATMAGIAFIIFAIIVVLPVYMGANLKIERLI